MAVCVLESPQILTCDTVVIRHTQKKGITKFNREHHRMKIMTFAGHAIFLAEPQDLRGIRSTIQSNISKWSTSNACLLIIHLLYLPIAMCFLSCPQQMASCAPGGVPYLNTLLNPIIRPRYGKKTGISLKNYLPYPMLIHCNLISLLPQ